MVALSAAGRFSIETRQRTLETLLTIPEREAIFPSKWRGSVLHVRRGWWILVWLLFMGLLADLNPLRVVLVVASWFASAALLASLGLSFSIITGSTTRATIFTLLSALLVGMGSTALAGRLIDPIMNIKHTPQGTLFLFATLAPPVTAWLNASSSYFFSLDPSFAFFLSLPGIAFHAIAAWVIFRFGSACFRMVAEPLAFRLQSPTRPFPPLQSLSRPVCWRSCLRRTFSS